MRPLTIRLAVLAAMFAIQVGGIGYARVAPTRFLAWAPYDQISFYRVEVYRNGRALPAAEIEGRYRLRAAGRENRSIDHVLAAIAHYEATRGADDPVRVRVVYRVNRGPEQVWTHG
jgi:hypothetical protein